MVNKFIGTRALEILYKVRKCPRETHHAVQLPAVSETKRRDSIIEKPLDLDTIDEAKVASDHDARKSTVLYLAYGSNLSAETFRGTRGIKPLSQMNVLVPSLALTFDLPGIPYAEPCFANTRRRDLEEPLFLSSDYHKDRWRKGLVGVVYEVTLDDYAKVIATEGGGASYQDITVDCYEIPAGSRIVDPHPASSPFKAHTLFAPSRPVGEPGKNRGGKPARPDPSYAQASARYLKLISDGAEEHGLPNDYREFLAQLRPYTITTPGQKMGQRIFVGFWMPIILNIFKFSRSIADEKGRVPAWLATVTNLVFVLMWLTYDVFFKKLFGDGERTIEAEDGMTDATSHNWADERKRLLRPEEGLSHKV